MSSTSWWRWYRKEWSGRHQEAEEVTYLFLGYCRGDVGALRHDGGVVVGDLPLSPLNMVGEDVVGLHHDTRVTHREPVQTLITREVCSKNVTFSFISKISYVKTNRNQW